MTSSPYFPTSFDSDEEKWFAWWCEELWAAGFIHWYGRCPTVVLGGSVILDRQRMSRGKKPVLKVYRENIVGAHVYTPDYTVVWSEAARGKFFQPLADDIFHTPFIGNFTVSRERTDVAETFGADHWLTISEDESCYFSTFEVKPEFNRHNMTRLAKINISWVMERYGVVVHIATMGRKIGLFKDTFCPVRWLVTKNNKARVSHFAVKTLQEYQPSTTVVQ